MRRSIEFFVWSLPPIVLAAAVTVLGLFASATAEPDPQLSGRLRWWTAGVAIALGAALIVKAIRDHRRSVALSRARINALEELHDRLGPALYLTTELILADLQPRALRAGLLARIATLAASALASMISDPPDVRVSVFQVAGDEKVEPIAYFGRAESPRSFLRHTAEGDEVFTYLENPSTELYPDTAKDAPAGYNGDRSRYRTFIRVPIWSATGIVFGMLTVDALRSRSLDRTHTVVAELIAAELEPAFANLTR